MQSGKDIEAQTKNRPENSSSIIKEIFITLLKFVFITFLVVVGLALLAVVALYVVCLVKGFPRIA